MLRTGKLIAMACLAGVQAIAAGLSGKIVFRAPDGHISVFDAQTGDITALKAEGQHANLSPDGRGLAYRDGRDRLHIVRLDNGADVLIATADNQYSPTFAGNDTVAFIREGRRSTDLCLSPVDALKERVWPGKLPFELLSFMQIEWVRGTPPQSPSFVLAAKDGLFLISPSGTRELVPRVAGVTCRYPAVSPDGKRVAFVMDDGRQNTCVLDLAGGKPQPLTRDGSSSWPAWSPDGGQIAFLTTAAVTRGLAVRDAITNENIRYTGGGSINRIAVMKADGTGVAVLLDRTGKEVRTAGAQISWR